MKQKKDFNKKLALNILIDPNLEKQGHENNYVFNLNIESDNQIGFFLQATEL
nr:MAG: hypothetical protein [Bacteriophage sp.]